MTYERMHKEAVSLIDKMTADDELTDTDKRDLLEGWAEKAESRIFDPRPKSASELKSLNDTLNYTKEKLSLYISPVRASEE